MAAQQRRVLTALLHQIPAGSSMQPAAVQAGLSLGLHALSADLDSEHSLGRRNVDIWGPVLSRYGPICSTCEVVCISRFLHASRASPSFVARAPGQCRSNKA